MAISRKGSRKIVVEETEFRWRATGNDGWISVVVWPAENDRSRLIGTVGYHQRKKKASDFVWTLHNQLIVTNRLIRRLILQQGVDQLLSGDEQVNVGALENIIDISDAVRADQ